MYYCEYTNSRYSQGRSPRVENPSPCVRLRSQSFEDESLTMRYTRPFITGSGLNPMITLPPPQSVCKFPLPEQAKKDDVHGCPPIHRESMVMIPFALSPTCSMSFSLMVIMFYSLVALLDYVTIVAGKIKSATYFLD